jgi:threonine dehydratase
MLPAQLLAARSLALARPHQREGAPVTLALRCAVCGATVDIASPYPFTCPNAAASDRNHVLHPLTAGTEPPPGDDPNPFVAYGPRLAWWAFARANGMTEAACVALTRDVAGEFRVTPFARSLPLSNHFGADVWVKDETGNVGGSHKGRHLAGALLHLRAAEALGLGGSSRSPLAIASCGNAAIAAATLAHGSEWPLEVLVPDWADERVLEILASLGARVTRCPRRPSDPPGDPSVLRFREAVRDGAIPFGVQGPENALCLDGGRTLGWELGDAGVDVDRVLVQVGGGAFAACTGWGLGPAVRLDAVQTEGCAPLARAWRRAADRGVAPEDLGSHWAELMTPWDDPRSAADGILDDETYDWLGVFEVMRRSGGRPLVVPESSIVEAHELAQRTGIPVSPTGSAGLAGLLTDDGRPTPGERVVVVFSGVGR